MTILKKKNTEILKKDGRLITRLFQKRPRKHETEKDIRGLEGGKLGIRWNESRVMKVWSLKTRKMFKNNTENKSLLRPHCLYLDCDYTTILYCGFRSCGAHTVFYKCTTIDLQYTHNTQYCIYTSSLYTIHSTLPHSSTLTSHCILLTTTRLEFLRSPSPPPYRAPLFRVFFWISLVSWISLVFSTLHSERHSKVTISSQDLSLFWVFTTLH